MNDQRDDGAPGRRVWIGVVTVLAVTAVGLLWRGRTSQDIALQSGLPGFLAVAVFVSRRPRYRMAQWIRRVVIAILLTGVLLADARVCLLLALLLFHYFSTLYSEDSLHVWSDARVLAGGRQVEDRP